MAALITAVLILVHLAVFMANPFPDTVAGWFELLQDNPLAGLVDLDLLLVVDNVLLVVIALALFWRSGGPIHLSPRWPPACGCWRSSCSSPPTRPCRTLSRPRFRSQEPRWSMDLANRPVHWGPFGTWPGPATQ